MEIQLCIPVSRRGNTPGREELGNLGAICNKGLNAGAQISLNTAKLILSLGQLELGVAHLLCKRADTKQNVSIWDKLEVGVDRVVVRSTTSRWAQVHNIPKLI